MRNLSVFLLLFTCHILLYSQENTGEGADMPDEYIRWLAQYPDADADSKRPFFQKVGTLFLGPKPDLLIKPVCAITDDSDHLWMLSQGNGYVLKIEEEKMKAVGGKIHHNNHYFPSLVSMCSLPGKGMLLTDSYLNEAILISEEDARISKFNTDAALVQPTGIAYSRSLDQVWIIETAAHRISVFDAHGTFVKYIGQRGSGPGLFNFPTHIWMDPVGRAYVVDAMNFRIQIFSEDGVYLSSFGKHGDASGCLARPKGIACDSNGNIYVADALFNTVQVFNIKGELLYYFGGSGTDKGQFRMPSGVYIDEEDYIYVSDSFNNRVQVFQVLKQL